MIALRKPTTKAQRWAQKRNLSKGYIKMMMSHLERMLAEPWITPEEKHELLDARQHLRWVHAKWDEQNGLSKARTLNES